jgi:hypothetical protein
MHSLLVDVIYMLHVTYISLLKLMCLWFYSFLFETP